MDVRWTFHAYAPSPDRQRVALHRCDGFELTSWAPDSPRAEVAVEYPRMQRTLAWSADSRWLATWVESTATARSRLSRKRPPAIGLVDARHPEFGATTVYDPATSRLPPFAGPGVVRVPFGIAWASAGRVLYVIERLVDAERGTIGSDLLRLELSGTRVVSVRELVRTTETLDFMVASSAGPERLLIGSSAGLSLLDASAGTQTPLGLPSGALFHVGWHPRQDQLLLNYRQPAVTADGETLRGLWLVDIEGERREQLQVGRGLHTVTWSPGGTYATWADDGEVAYRRPQDPPDRTQRVDAPTPAGGLLAIKGVAWSDDETRLALTADDRLLVHTVGRPGAEEQLQLLPLTADVRHLFLAEPCWAGDRILFSAYEDLTGRR